MKRSFQRKYKIFLKGCLGKTCGGLDIVSAGIGYALAQGDLLLVGQQAGLDDDL